MTQRILWTRDELILAFNLYLKLPFGKMHHSTPEVIELATILNRSPNSIALRLGNFAACDPFEHKRGIKGLTGGLKQCKPIWDEFINNKESLLYESERILAGRQNKTIEDKFKEFLTDITELKGESRNQLVKARVNQNIFRQIILCNYNNRCAITGIDVPDLLIASHIIPWAEEVKERLNPENGICLSALYDKAYDKGLIGINESYKILISSELKQRQDTDFYNKHFASIDGQRIELPKKFKPRKEFLQFHLDTIFEKRNII
jgi:Predicted restriction endonuclease